MKVVDLSSDFNLTSLQFLDVDKHLFIHSSCLGNRFAFAYDKSPNSVFTFFLFEY